jgi:hypothetical protein
MYHILIFMQLFFLKFVVHEINFEIIKSEMMVLTERENTDMTDIDVDWIL